ncbi:hypothetical protein [Dethiothermospora halolimnae]|uniref:hypothetical protein n=1 Tax=Dethiothermospora halolimnae TaxID=3114390 RepID=UPI003CCBD70A
MKQSIIKLKKLVSEYESYIYINNKKKIEEISNNIIELVTKMKEGDIPETNNENSDKTDNLYKENLEKINEISFLYKPLMKKNYFEGNYLEKFGEERTEQLKMSGALQLHDKFWTSNNVEKGNVFGSVPKDLISSESANKLINFGWRDCNVTAYEVSDKTTYGELVKICNILFKHYLIVTEMKNKTLLVLEYRIERY